MMRKNIGYLLLLAACVCIMLAAGCTNTSPAPAVTAPSQAPVSAFSSFTLAPSDLPAGYTQTLGREKTESEVTRLAHDSGWQGGYVAVFENSSSAAGSGSMIVQTITGYPAANIPGIISIIKQQETSGTVMEYTAIPSPGIGDASGGFTATARSSGVAATTGNSLFTSVTPARTLAPEELPQDFAEVYFSKGNILEVIRLTGPGADAATVTTLARTAYSKIP